MTGLWEILASATETALLSSFGIHPKNVARKSDYNQPAYRGVKIGLFTIIILLFWKLSGHKKKKGIRNKQRHFIFLLDDGTKGINPIVKIRVSADDIDTGKGIGLGIFKHVAPPL